MYCFKYNTPLIDALSKVDLRLFYCGTEDCERGHSWGPAIKDHYKIHYIHSGKGLLKVGDKQYTLHAGQCFLIVPNMVSFYKADEEDPWTYYWVAFDGINSLSYLNRAGLGENSPILSCDKDKEIVDCFHQMFRNSENQKTGDLDLLGCLYNFLSILIEQNTTFNSLQAQNAALKNNLYITKALELIEMNYSSNISISEIADNIGLSRKYFSKLFKESMGYSPISFLIKFRLNKSCQLMENQNLTIGEISRSVGYEDQLLFSRTFHKFMGVSPSEYRKNI